MSKYVLFAMFFALSLVALCGEQMATMKYVTNQINRLDRRIDNVPEDAKIGRIYDVRKPGLFARYQTFVQNDTITNSCIYEIREDRHSESSDGIRYDGELMLDVIPATGTNLFYLIALTNGNYRFCSIIGLNKFETDEKPMPTNLFPLVIGGTVSGRDILVKKTAQSEQGYGNYISGDASIRYSDTGTLVDNLATTSQIVNLKSKFDFSSPTFNTLTEDDSPAQVKNVINAMIEVLKNVK